MRLNFFGDFIIPPLFSKKEIIITEPLKYLIHNAHINIINFEAPSLPSLKQLPTPIKKSGPHLFQDSNAPKWLSNNGFTHASLANNHIMDYGEDGLRSTFDYTHNELITFGAGSWDKAYKPIIIHLEGKKVAILSFTHGEFGVLTDKWDYRYMYGTAWINHPDVDTIITRLRETVDYIFIFAHAGLEHAMQPLPEWRDRYHALIEIGCDGIIASHPHITQGWEIFKGKPIVYSLGNFYFPKVEKQSPSWYRSICASIDIVGHDINLKITPLVFDNYIIDFDNSIKTQEYLNNINKVLNDSSLYIQYVNTYCKELLEHYYHLFESGGLIRMKPNIIIKNIIKRYIMHSSYSTPNLLNNIRCESHRYSICRALKLMNDIR